MEPGGEPWIPYTSCLGRSGTMPSLVLDAAAPNVVRDCISVLADTHMIGSLLACSQVKPLRVLWRGVFLIWRLLLIQISPFLFCAFGVLNASFLFVSIKFYFILVSFVNTVPFLPSDPFIFPSSFYESVNQLNLWRKKAPLSKAWKRWRGWSEKKWKHRCVFGW